MASPLHFPIRSGRIHPLQSTCRGSACGARGRSSRHRPFRVAPARHLRVSRMRASSGPIGIPASSRSRLIQAAAFSSCEPKGSTRIRQTQHSKASRGASSPIPDRISSRLGKSFQAPASCTTASGQSLCVFSRMSIEIHLLFEMFFALAAAANLFSVWSSI